MSLAAGCLRIFEVLPFLTTIISKAPQALLPARMMVLGARVIFFLHSEVGIVGDHLKRVGSSSACRYCPVGRYWQRQEVGYLPSRNRNTGGAFHAPQQNSWR